MAAEPTLSKRLFNAANGGCPCGGKFKWTGVQMRCDRCDIHQGWPVKPQLQDLLREAARAVKRHA